MAPRAVVEATVDLLRVVAHGRTVGCEVLLQVNGEAIAFGFAFSPVGISPGQVMAELQTRLRSIKEILLAGPNVETDEDVHRRLREMELDLEQAVVGTSL